MKDISKLVNNYQPITEHKEDLVIDEFAKGIVDRVFNNLAIIFPAWKHNWKSDDPTDPEKVLRSAKREWTKAFVENNICTTAQISHGFAKARKSESDFLPSCGKFVSWCSPTPEDLGYPNEQRALMLCVSYRSKLKLNMATNTRPLIMELCNRIDWWLMNAASTQPEHKKAEAHFKAEYMSLINSGYQEPTESSVERLETADIVVDRMSPEQLESRKNRGLDAVKAMRQGLAKAKREELSK